MHIINRIKSWLFGETRSMPVEITISDGIIEDVCTMARQAHPKEMFIFLASSKGGKNGTWHINELHIQAYESSVDSANVMTSNIPMTSNIIGTIHSHPGGSARPSDQDLHFYSKIGFVHAIIAEPYGRKNIRFYNKNGTRTSVTIVDDKEDQ